MIVVYIAGPFRGSSAWDIEQNIRRAEELALEVWRLGMALCPHTNTRHFQGAAPDEVWMSGDIELMRRCDARVPLLFSQFGASRTAEVQKAKEWRLPVFENLNDLLNERARIEKVL
jgi:hypothetical protein